MSNKIEIKVPDGKEAKQTTDENGNISIQFVDKPKEKTLQDYVDKTLGLSLELVYDKNGYIDADASSKVSPKRFEPLKLSPYQAIRVLDAIARDLNGDWKWKLGTTYYYIILNNQNVYIVDGGEYSRCASMFKDGGSVYKAIEICGTEFLDIIYRRFEK